MKPQRGVEMNRDECPKLPLGLEVEVKRGTGRYPWEEEEGRRGKKRGEQGGGCVTRSHQVRVFLNFIIIFGVF